MYYDSLGYLTGGYGHCFQLGGRLPDDIWYQIFRYDLMQAEAIVERLGIPDHILGQNRRGVLIDMAFNLGEGLFKFRRMIDALRRGDYEGAAQHMLDSQWAKQVGARARELAGLMRAGSLPAGFI
ncbi:MAG: glycoside hydrolase family protein [Chloroflexota bacterium]